VFHKSFLKNMSNDSAIAGQLKWKDLTVNKIFLIESLLTILFLIIILFSLARFLNFVEARSGVIIPDPLLSLINPVDLTWVIFGFIYSSLLIAIIALIKDPFRLLTAIQVYCIMIVLRMAVMFVTPLEPPANMISLRDPFVEYFGTGQLLTKDLFFSGHTATLFLLYLVAVGKQLKIFFLISTIIVAVSVLLQHVHYTIDVLSAPLFAYISFWVLHFVKRKR